MDAIKYMIVGVICLVLGGGVGFLAEWGNTRIELATIKSEKDKAESEKDKAILEKTTMQLQWEKAVNELNQTKVLLNDTLAALKLLKDYKAVDKKVQEDIIKIEKTLDPKGEVTEDTYDEFRRLAEEFNRLQGNTSARTTGVTTAGQLDIQPFIDLREDAAKLLQEATDLLMKFKGK